MTSDFNNCKDKSQTPSYKSLTHRIRHLKSPSFEEKKSRLIKLGQENYKKTRDDSISNIKAWNRAADPILAV